jgi:hypothetical protein
MREATGRETPGRKRCPVEPSRKFIETWRCRHRLTVIGAGFSFQSHRGHLLSVKRVVMPFKIDARRAIVPRSDMPLYRVENSDDPSVAPQFNGDAMTLGVIAGQLRVELGQRVIQPVGQ